MAGATTSALPVPRCASDTPASWAGPLSAPEAAVVFPPQSTEPSAAATAPASTALRFIPMRNAFGPASSGPVLAPPQKGQGASRT